MSRKFSPGRGSRSGQAAAVNVVVALVRLNEASDLVLVRLVRIRNSEERLIQKKRGRRSEKRGICRYCISELYSRIVYVVAELFYIRSWERNANRKFRALPFIFSSRKRPIGDFESKSG